MSSNISIYKLTEIIISNGKKNQYYVGTFEGTESADIDWPHRHDFYSIVWFTNSHGINVIDFEEYGIKPDRIFFMQPKQVHNWSYMNDSKGYTMVLDKHLVPKETIGLFNTVYFDLSKEEKNLLEVLFKNFIKEFNQVDEHSDELLISGIFYLLHQLNKFALGKKNGGTKKNRSKIAYRFLKIVTETISDNKTVSDYAKSLNLTNEKLVEICQESYGQGPKALILEKKITEAKRLLYFTDKTISEIAYDLGFDDNSYFSRLFKLKTGISPTDFKNTR